MIRGLVAAGLLQVLVGAFGWPIDALLPVAVALAFAPGPLAARIGAALGVGAIAAALSGDVVSARVVTYGVAVVGSAILADRVEDHAGTRAVFVTLAFGATVFARDVLAWVGSTPGPADSWLAVVATGGWAFAHAALSGVRAPRWSVPAPIVGREASA